MIDFKEKYERAVGEDFIEWLNSERGTKYRFKECPDRAPDLIYTSDSNEIFIEVTSAFYDDEHAKFIWKSVRGEADAPTRWIGVNPNKRLVDEICSRLIRKAQKRYEDETLLLIEIPPGITSAEELSELLDKQQFPKNLPFAGIYVVGNFPIKKHSIGGFRAIPFKEL